MGRIKDTLADLWKRIRGKKQEQLVEQNPRYNEIENDIEQYSIEKAPEQVQAEMEAKIREESITRIFDVVKNGKGIDEICKKDVEGLDTADVYSLLRICSDYRNKRITDDQIENIGGIVQLVNRISTDARIDAIQKCSEESEYSIQDLDQKISGRPDELIPDPYKTICKMMESKGKVK